MRCLHLVVLGLWFACLGRPAGAAEITVAAAADLRFALDELAQEFQTNSPGSTVKVTYGSSGQLFAQIQNQAPFDLFFSADIEYPRRLAAAGLGLETNVFRYAIGRLVVWVPTNSPVEVNRLGMQALLDPAVKRIAIAQPQHAPYGRAAVAAMKSLGVYSQAEPRLVYGENIAQTAQFVQSGAADIGIIARSLAVAPQMRTAGRFWEIPAEAYPRLEQGGLLLKGAKEADAARAFRDFVLGPRGRDVLKRHGFHLPEAGQRSG
jgi:molybdate transport system substrate-binding protein